MIVKQKIAFLLILVQLIVSSLGLSGCGVKQNEDKDDNRLKNEYSTEQSVEPVKPSVSPSVNPEVSNSGNSGSSSSGSSQNTVGSLYEIRNLTEQDVAFIKGSIAAGVGLLEEAKDKINQIEVIYPYSELYEAVNNVRYDYTPSVISFRIIVGGEVDVDALYNIVLANNEAYMDRYNVNAYKETDNRVVREICEILAAQITDAINGCRSIDIALMEEKLNDLKIFTYNDFGNGFYDIDKGIMAVNKNNVHDTTVNHETVHLIQAASVREIEENGYNLRNGYCYEYDNNVVNPTYWYWFIEACAEKLGMEYTGAETPAVYKEALGCLDRLKLVMLNNSNDLEETLYSTDVGKVYEFFGAPENISKEELQKMFYAYNIVYASMPLQEGHHFYTQLRERGVVFDGASVLALNDEVLNATSITETKIFYQNLIDKIKGKEVVLADVFAVISTFELEMASKTWYHTEYRDFEYFLREYTNIQVLFFDALATSYGCSLEEMKDMYVMYNYHADLSTFYIDWLSEDENAVLRKYQDVKGSQRRNAILKIYSDYYGVNVSRD